jgi:dual specificity MAP kinase phosphatase
MPTSSTLSSTYRRLLDLDRRRHHPTEEQPSAYSASPATLALRNLLSPTPPASPLPEAKTKRTASPSADDLARQQRHRSRLAKQYVALDCAGSCRTLTGQMRNLASMTDKVVDLVYFLRKIVEGRDKTGIKRRILVHCQDGYTESSIVVLSYLMSSLSCSLAEAFLHLQLNAKRSFFLYPSDKPLLRKIDAKLAADRKAKALKVVSTAGAGGGTELASPASSTSGSASPSRWKSWGMGFASPDTRKDKEREKEREREREREKQRQTVEVARELLQGSGPDKDLTWFDDKRFDGFPSRILPFLYLGNL